MLTESQEQQWLFQWAGISEQQFSELRLLYHVPNGGRRDKKEAASLKRQGVKAGVPDLFLPSPHGGYFGLYIELKVGKNKTSKIQDEWIEQLKEQGYFVEVCYGWLAASEVIKYYLEKPKTIVIKS